MSNTHLQESLDKLRFLFDNGWDYMNSSSVSDNSPQLLIQLSAADLVQVAVEVSLMTCQALVDSHDKLTNKHLLNRTQAAEYLGCTRQTLINYENAGIVVPIRLNGQPYYRQEDLDNASDRRRLAGQKSASDRRSQGCMNTDRRRNARKQC